MKINITTDNAQVLLNLIRTKTRSEKLPTWSIDDDGDFFHTPEQWHGKGWLRPAVSQGLLQFRFVSSESGFEMGGYSHIQARFTGMLINHFNEYFDFVTTFSQPQDQIDLIS